MTARMSTREVNGVEYSYPADRYANPNRRDGRKAINGKKGWQVAEMWDNHHEIARRIVLGESVKDVAAAVGVTPQQVTNVKNSPVVMEKLAVMRAARDAGCIDLARDIADLAPIAIKRIKEALETGSVLGKELSGSSVLKEANSLLDREIGKAVQRVDTRGVHAVLSSDDIRFIKERANELTQQV